MSLGPPPLSLPLDIHGVRSIRERCSFFCRSAASSVPLSSVEIPLKCCSAGPIKADRKHQGRTSFSRSLQHDGRKACVVRLWMCVEMPRRTWVSDGLSSLLMCLLAGEGGGASASLVLGGGTRGAVAAVAGLTPLLAQAQAQAQLLGPALQARPLLRTLSMLISLHPPQSIRTTLALMSTWALWQSASAGRGWTTARRERGCSSATASPSGPAR